MYDFFWQTYFVFHIYANNFGQFSHMYNAHEVLSWQHQYRWSVTLTTSNILHCKPYLFFHIYDPKGFLAWQSYSFFFTNAYEVFTAIYKLFTFGSYIWSFTSVTTCGFLVWYTYSFFLIYANIFWNCPHKCIYKKTKAYAVLCSHPQIFYIVNHICSFTSMIPKGFLAWQSYPFFSQMPMMFLLPFINFSHLVAISGLSHLWPLVDSLFGTHIPFSLFMLISFEIVHTSVYIKNLKPMQCYVHTLKYFTL